VAFVAPQLGALAANGGPTWTAAPLPGSPAIDRVASGCPPPAADQRGSARPYGSRCDTGAVEWRLAADLVVTLSAEPSAAEGRPLSWTIGVTNAGPSAANGAVVSDSFPATVTGVAWTCVGSGGATCPASGTGNVSMSVNLPAGGGLTIEATGTVSGLAGARQVTNSVSVAVPAGMDDPDPSDNSASLAVPVERAMRFHTLTPCRLVDTRGAAGSRGGPALAARVARTFPIAGACSVPSTAWAVSLNVTVTQPTANGNVRLYPGGTPVPLASTLNYAAGLTSANDAIAALGTNGDLMVLASQASGFVHLILDVNGYLE
jgi:uncharacterized repeat protein (TIGR01451 family)